MRGFRGRHFLTVQDYTREELMEMITFAVDLKRACKKGYATPLLKGKYLGMIFEEPSTRTRISFEVGMSQLGGKALYLRPGEIHLGAKESVGDTAQVMSRFLDGIMARLYKHTTLLEMAKYASVPVINGLTDWFHPTQALADALTMYEKAGTLSGVKVAFLGDATNVCNSLVLICSKLGMDLSVANPRKYIVKPEIQEMAKANAELSGARIEYIEDPIAAVHGADFVYTDLWWWVDQEDEAEERKAAMAPYQVNNDLMAKANPGAKFMHCLPAARGLEATDEVMDGPQSIIFDQAENRLHAHKAILAYLLQDYSRDVDPNKEAEFLAYLQNRLWQHQ